MPDIPHANLDNVFKESLTLFKDKTLDFLNIPEIAPIADYLGTENVQIELTWESMDLAFGTSDGQGVHLEEEINLSNDDLLRFLGYNASLSRIHKREFATIIFVKNPTNLEGINTK